MHVVAYLLDIAEIGRERLVVKWVSAAEGRVFADYVTRISQRTRELGPFDPGVHRLSLSAVEAALRSPRLRWLMGMELQITDRGNVYQERVEEATYRKLLEATAEEEYEKALVLDALEEGDQSVREVALRTGLPVQRVSFLIGELEKGRRANFRGYAGQAALFGKAVMDVA